MSLVLFAVLWFLCSNLTTWAARIEESTNNVVKVEVLFVRHGHGCHNALKYHTAYDGTTAIGSDMHCEYPDPPLTDCGVANSEANGLELNNALTSAGWQPQFVGSSSMIRAIETASFMFPSYQVSPLPFISENGDELCNKPKALAEQKAQLPGDSIDWQYVSQVSNEAREAADYEKFRAFLGEHIVPGLVAKNSIVKVAIVSHSMFLRTVLEKYFNCEYYFVNNAAMLTFYDFDVSSKQLVESTSPDGRPCAPPLEHPPSKVWGKEKKYSCPADYARCFLDPNAMGKEDGVAGDQSPWIQAHKPGQECCV